jgi:hypothetical protein
MASKKRENSSNELFIVGSKKTVPDAPGMNMICFVW